MLRDLLSELAPWRTAELRPRRIDLFDGMWIAVQNVLHGFCTIAVAPVLAVGQSIRLRVDMAQVI
jgi:hypothetical protein